MIRITARSHSTGDYLLPEDAQLPLFVVSCGHQYHFSKDFSVLRPNGRPDYQLLYLCSGCGHFLKNGVWEKVSAGSIILYTPHQPQIYTYLAEDNPEIYWIHFSGCNIRSLLEAFQIHDSLIGTHHALKQVFEEIILELQLHKFRFQDIAGADFHKLLALVNRFMQLQDKPQTDNPLIDHLITQLHSHYMDTWDKRAMSDFCHLGIDHFSHRFKDTIGVSPMRFLTSLRMERAKELLLTESLSVSEAARLVGYQDPLYFSRVFKKFTGISPGRFHGNRERIDLWHAVHPHIR